MKRKKLLAGLLFGAGAAAPTTPIEEGKPIWIQIATEGVYKGHPSSPDGAVFSREFFDKVIANFRRDPAYKAGPDGIGMTHVLPTDYEHASELDPTTGSIPMSGAPSPSWVMDLQVRNGESGKAELWALTDVTSATLRDQLNGKEYRWTSIAVWPDAIDAHSGERVGPTMTSFAYTNHPFIQGMHPIAASAWVSRAESPEEVVIGLRDIFQLSSEATPEQVSAELDEFCERMLQGTLPEGVKACDVIDRLRGLLGIRLLASNDEVLEAARQMLAGVGYTEEVNGAKPHQEPNQEQELPNMNLSTKIAAILKCRDTDDSILCAAEETAKAAAGASDALKQLQDMFGSKDLQSLVKAASEQIALAKKAEGLVAALQAANDSMGAGMEAEAEAETDAVVATITADKTVASRIRPAILSQRKGCVTEQDVFGTKVRKLDDEKIKAFRTLYPLPPADLEALTKRIFAAPGGQQITFRADDKGNLQQTTVAPDERTPGGEDRRAKVRTLAGRNDTERAMTLLSKERAGFDKLDRLDQVRAATAWLQGQD